MSAADKHKLANILNRIFLASQIIVANPAKTEKYIGMINESTQEALILLKKES